MIKSIRLLHYDAVDPITGGIWFDNQTHAAQSAADLTQVVVPIETYHNMGDPEEITVTIEPGDKLNDHPKGAL